MSEDEFSKARLDSAIKSNYGGKVSKNNARRNFIDKYTSNCGKMDDELLKAAKECIMAEKGIVIEKSSLNYEIDITEETLNSLYVAIKKNSDDNFKYFFESYKRKIEYEYSDEYISSALRDLKTAYHTLRKCNILDWQCPDELINLTEMENLYSCLVQDYKPKKTTEKSRDD